MLSSPRPSSQLPCSFSPSSPSSRVASLSLPPPTRSYIHECMSLNKLLFIRPVGEMNLRDSYRTRPDMHDGFEPLSLLPNGFPLSLPPPLLESLTVDRCFRRNVCHSRWTALLRDTIVIRINCDSCEVVTAERMSFSIYFSLSLSLSFKCRVKERC